MLPNAAIVEHDNIYAVLEQKKTLHAFLVKV